MARSMLDQGPCRFELVDAQANVGMAPEALRKDARLLDGRGTVEIRDGEQRPDRKAPRPACSLRIVLWDTRDLDDAEDRLPHGRVEDRELARLERRPLGGRVGDDLLDADVPLQRLATSAPNEQPARTPQSRSTTAAIAWPWPMHIVAIP